eukprot:6818140-Pyramimonas_sp.AAC.2
MHLSSYARRRRARVRPLFLDCSTLLAYCLLIKLAKYSYFSYYSARASASKRAASMSKSSRHCSSSRRTCSAVAP